MARRRFDRSSNAAREPRTRSIYRRSGFSLVEVLLAAVILAVAVTGIAGSVLSALALNRVNRETALAQQAARRAVEQVSSVPFSEAFACYNADAGDDAGLLIAARGPGFAVPGLTPLAGDADGMCGRVMFPTVVNAGGNEELREDSPEPTLGMPRDLDFDGQLVPDLDDHADDYRILPVRVRIEWQGISGQRQVDLETILSDR